MASPSRLHLDHLRVYHILDEEERDLDPEMTSHGDNECLLKSLSTVWQELWCLEP
jgi:hypothetical protein